MHDLSPLHIEACLGSETHNADLLRLNEKYQQFTRDRNRLQKERGEEDKTKAEAACTYHRSLRGLLTQFGD